MTDRESLETLSLMRSLLHLKDSELYWSRDYGVNAKAGHVAGHTHADGYRRLGFNGKSWRAHRIIFALYHGRWPNGHIDHINGILTDNRIENLREVQARGNARNRKLSKANRSGVTGVSFHKTTNKWQANICTNNGFAYLGLYGDFFEACCVRKSSEINLGYHPNHGKTAEQRQGDQPCNATPLN